MRFNGSEQALRYAYNMSQRVIAASPNYESVGRSTSKEGLGPHELHAQGALILQALNRLPAPECNALKTLYAPDPLWMKPAAEMTEYMWPSLRETIPTQSTAYDALITWAKREGRSVRSLMKLYGVNYRQANKWRGAIGYKFHPIYVRAVGLLDDDLFKEGGLEKK